jgi:hypothetical protein
MIGLQKMSGIDRFPVCSGFGLYRFHCMYFSFRSFQIFLIYFHIKISNNSTIRTCESNVVWSPFLLVFFKDTENSKLYNQNWENVTFLCFTLCARLRESHTLFAFSQHYLEENVPFYPNFNVFLLLYLGKTEILNT